MQNLKVLPGRSEVKMENLIFDACRANPNREPRELSGGFSAKFTANYSGGHECVLRNAAGVVVATADVDEFDC